MRIAEVIGTVTLSRMHPTVERARWLIGVPFSLNALRQEEPHGDGEDFVIFDELGAGKGHLIAVSEGVEAAAPFFPDKKPLDAYCACILDRVNMAKS